MKSSETNRPGERKAFAAPKEAKANVNRAMDEFFRGFEAFKEANDQRLAEIERKNADVVTAEKVERINDALTEMKSRIDQMTVAGRRPPIAGSTATESSARKAFQDFLRKGVGAGSSLELKGLSGTSGPAGGYLIPSEVEAMIDRILPQISPIRAIASVRQIGTSMLKKPFTTTGAAIRLGRRNRVAARDQRAGLGRARFSDGGALRDADGDERAAR